MAENSILICIRIPKSASQSLVRGLEAAFAGRGIFYVPDTLDPDSKVSRLHRLRFLRSRYRNLFRRYGTRSMRAVWARIEREATPGSLLMGGHVDFRTASAHLSRPLKSITILRQPVERARSEYDYMRQGYARKPRISRFDSSVLHRRAGILDFDSYLDFLFSHRGAYGDIACRYIGWDGTEDLALFFARNVFHCGVLNSSGDFATALSRKLARPFALPSENRTAGERPAITARQRALLEQIYARDMELYDWVRRNY